MTRTISWTSNFIYHIYIYKQFWNTYALYSVLKKKYISGIHNVIYHELWICDYLTSALGEWISDFVFIQYSLITRSTDVNQNTLWHDDVIKRKHFPCYWPFMQGIHRSPVNSRNKGQWRGALMFSLICVWISGWVNTREAGDLRRHGNHYDVTVMMQANRKRITSSQTRSCLWLSVVCFTNTPQIWWKWMLR